MIASGANAKTAQSQLGHKTADHDARSVRALFPD
jgi:hypothetical protein